MKAPDPIFDAKVTEKDGKKVMQFAPGEKPAIDRWIQTFKVGQRLDVFIKRHSRKRTNKQNAYYWKIVVPIIGEHFAYDNQEDVHADLKLKFNPVESKIEPGKIVGGTTTKMSTIDFMVADDSYVERICRWAAMEHQIYIPPPKKED